MIHQSNQSRKCINSNVDQLAVNELDTQKRWLMEVIQHLGPTIKENNTSVIEI